MSGRLIGKVALVSGGARGMGASHVRAMVAEGAKVVFGDILDEEGKAVAAELADAARYVHLDVTQPAQWTAAVDTAVTAFGGLHVLVNNAGILNIGTIEDYALTEWQRILDVNLTGVFLGIRAVVKPMKEAGRGSIINISSIEGWPARLLVMAIPPPSSPCEADQVHRSRVGAQRNSSQLDSPWVGQDADD